ncbi:MAG TPA: hypothetical protein VGH43_03650 [Jatrophihabitans sp.]
MIEQDTGADFEESFVRRGRCGLASDAESVGSPPDRGCICDRIGCCYQHESLRRLGQTANPPQIVLCELRRNATLSGKPETAGQFRGTHPSRQLEQCEWIATGFGDDAVTDPVVEQAWNNRCEQGPRVVLGHAADGQHWEILERMPGDVLADGHHHRDRLGREPPRDEAENLHRGVVEPLRVVDQAHQRLVLSGFSQQAERGKTDQEAIGRLTVDQAEGGTQGGSLRFRQAVDMVDDLGAQLVQPGVREFDLGLHAADPGNSEVRRPPGQIAEQCGFPHPGFTADYERFALAVLDTSKQVVQHTLFLLSPTHRRDRSSEHARTPPS